jgi:hypothetical protein
VQIVAKPDDIFAAKHPQANEILAYFYLRDGTYAELSRGEWTKHISGPLIDSESTKLPIWIVSIQKYDVPVSQFFPIKVGKPTVKLFHNLTPALTLIQGLS